MSTKSKQFVPIWELVKDKELVKQTPLLISMSILRDLPQQKKKNPRVL
jgi:hypothetical protein